MEAVGPLSQGPSDWTLADNLGNKSHGSLHSIYPLCHYPVLLSLLLLLLLLSRFSRVRLCATP